MATMGAPPPATTPTPRRSYPLVVPRALINPGLEMLKVSAKAASRVKSRRVWLELGGTTGAKEASGAGEGEGDLLGLNLLELGVGCVERSNGRIASGGNGREIRICWEKSRRGVGPKRQASVPLSSLRDVRFGTSGSPYRTSLHLSPSVEPRWFTLIYLAPQSSPLALLNPSSTPSYKLVHFIAPSEEVLGLWKAVLEGWKEAKARGGVYSVVIEAQSDAANAASKKGEASGQVVEERVVKEEDVHRLCSRLGMGISREEVSAAFRNSSAPKDYLDFAAFQKFVQLLKRRKEVEDIYLSLVGSDPGFDIGLWTKFLLETQRSTLSPLDMGTLFARYADQATRRVVLEGFSSFLLSSDNPPIKPDADQDMSRPLSEYYISSSHNTYLVGNQLQGESTIEGYIRALQQGCRCVELDIWPGPGTCPVITHGRTLTKSIPAQAVIHAIAEYAFLASPYPVILSLEVHCDVAQQDALVKILTEDLGSRLVTEKILGEGEGEVEKLPSPEDLRGKVLVKAKNLFITNLNKNGPPGSAGFPLDLDTSSTESPSSDSDFKRALKAVRKTFDDHRPSLTSHPSDSSGSSTSTLPLRQRSSSFLESALPPPLSPTSKSPMSHALASLLVYTIGVKARGFNKKETYSPNHVLSFGENRLTRMIKDEGVRHDLVGHNRNHLMRAYPKGIRVTSTNYEPHHLWAVGVQMVAVNWQTFDIGMEINAAMFSRAGRSGYVLKPELLRKKGAEKDKESLVKVARYVLELEIISAQQLPRARAREDASNLNAGSGEGDSSNGMSIDPFIEVSLFVPGVPAPIKRRTKVVSRNAFNPIFNTTFTLPFTFHPSLGMLDLVFLRLEVLDAKGTSSSNVNNGGPNYIGEGDQSPSGSTTTTTATAGGGRGFVGAYTTSVERLLPGYRHLPLYDSVGDQHIFSTVFVKSKCVLLGEGP